MYYSSKLSIKIIIFAKILWFMKYITDTDFLPPFGGIDDDAYQLIYGTVFYKSEQAVYNAVLKFCKLYTDSCYRKSKIDYWQHLIDECVEKLSIYQNGKTGDVMVHIPYRLLICTPDTIIRRFRFLQKVLQNVRDVEMLDNLEEQNGPYRIMNLSPLPHMIKTSTKVMARFYQIEEGKMAEMIDAELYRRGYVHREQSSSDFNKNSYLDFFFKNEDLGDLPTSTGSELDIDGENEDNIIQGSKVRTVGFLYYALTHFITNARGAGKTEIPDMVSKATWSIAHGLYKPEEQLNSNKMSDSTEYIYVQRKEFEKKTHNLKYIKDVLKHCNIEIPHELSKLLKKK
jgi:hypothetical protein